MNLRIRI